MAAFRDDGPGGESRVDRPGIGGRGEEHRASAGSRVAPNGGEDIRTLLSQLGRDASQLAHDELALARLELRGVADTLTGELREAARTIVANFAKIGVALVFALLAGLAITAGCIIGIGLLVDAYWAGALIVGAVWLVVAAVLGMSAARKLREPESPLRMGRTRRAAEHGSDVLASEVGETRDFVKEEGREFRRRVTPPEKRPPEVH